MKENSKRFFSLFLVVVVLLSSLTVPSYAAGINFGEGGIFGTIVSWLGGTVLFDEIWGTDHSGDYAANQPQKYYTTPTESVEDENGNVTNYYREGDTSSTQIIDSYNDTFSTIHNTTNDNDYEANIKLSEFLNTYATYTDNYTYNMDFKSWYYDNTSNSYSYDASQTYYNTDNSQYYISIDNSVDEYYLVDVHYSPTFVTVNYTYNTTNNNGNNYGNVTNVYYFELTDGRNSSALSADEVAGLDLGYDVANYELVTDDPNTLSLQHFDENYSDNSSYGRTFYSENRSTVYVDSGSFGKAVKLSSGSAAGVTIPGLSGYDGLTFDFRVYYDKIDSLGIYLGNKNLMGKIPSYAEDYFYQRYWDDNEYFHFDDGTLFCSTCSTTCRLGYQPYKKSEVYSYLSDPDSFPDDGGGYVDWSTDLKDYSIDDVVPDEYSWVYPSVPQYGCFEFTNPVLGATEEFKATDYFGFYGMIEEDSTGKEHEIGCFEAYLSHSLIVDYKASVTKVVADFNYSSYVNQWVPMRITIDDGMIYYFVNGDLVGSGAFSMPDADKFYIKSSGTVYLDELRITSGDMVYSGVYTPSSDPYDTNKVLALPTTLTKDTIYTRHSIPVTAWRIGGVRPSNPSTGFLYIPLYDDYTGGQAQFYDGSNWVEVEAMVYDGSTSDSAKGFTFTPMGASTDVDSDFDPSDPDSSGSGSCSHTWEESFRNDATCSVTGSVSYTCSTCGSSKTETLSKLSHTWEVKQSVQTTYDDSGNILTEGYTIYRCSVCGEEYKDSDGSGPPVKDPSSGSGSGSNTGWFGDLMDSIGEFFGTTIGGFLELIGTLITNVLDSLITLVSSAIERINQLVGLFGSFSETLVVFWGWLPEEIVTVFLAGVTIMVLFAIIKMFLK